jgi:hypothetical protein
MITKRWYGDCCNHEYTNANSDYDPEACPGSGNFCERGLIICGDPPDACPPSPIVIDTDGKGFDLTDEISGAVFDIYDSGHPVQVSWTSAGSRNAWLVLDTNGNGKIDNASELFGNHTPPGLVQKRSSAERWQRRARVVVVGSPRLTSGSAIGSQHSG